MEFLEPNSVSKFSNNFCFHVRYSEQPCLYQIEQGGLEEGYKPVRSIKANMTGDDYGGYAKHQQCWASFKCPSDMFAYWRVVQIDIEAGF